MKASIHLPALLLTILLIVSVSCKKEKMPDEDKDWNVLEWTVDGEQYKAECEGDPLFGCDPVDCQYYHDVKTLEYYGSSSEFGAIKVYKYQNIEIGINELEEFDKLNFITNNATTDCQIFRSDTINYLFEIVYIDTVNKLIEGQFEFTGINDCQDTTKVTDGYFKLSYRP